MVRSTLPYLHHWTGLRLILGVPALLHDFDPLAPYFQQKYLTDQDILRSYFRTMLELGACLIWARLDHGKSRPGQEMCHQKCQNFDEKLNFWRFFKNDPRSTWNRSKTKKTQFSCKKQWFLNKMVRSTLLHLPLCGAFGWFWRPRAGAWFWPFDPILLIDILHESRNP